MSKWGSVDFRQLKNFQKKLEKLDTMQHEFCEAAAKELAARLLRKVIQRTPVGQYPQGSGMVGGTLRRGWTGNTKNGAAYAQSLPVRREGNNYVIDVINPVEYASYVEYGHRTRGHKGWVQGRFMLTISVDEIQSAAPKILEKKLAKWLGDMLNGN
jgi:hypothetical protein